MPIQVNDLLNELKNNIITLAKASFVSFAKEAEEDAVQLWESMKEKLERWTLLLAEGQLTLEDFELLVTAQKDLVAMTALQKAGLAAIKAEQFRNSLINLITDTIFSAIPGLK